MSDIFSFFLSNIMLVHWLFIYLSFYFIYSIIFLLPFIVDETLSQASSATSASASGVYEIPARLRTLHNLVIQYASQVGIYSLNPSSIFLIN